MVGVRRVADKVRGWGSGKKMQVCMHKSELERKVGNGVNKGKKER